MKLLRALCLTSLMCFLVAPPAAAQLRGDMMGFISGGATLSDFAGGGVSTSSRWGGTAGLGLGFRTSRNTVVTLEGAWIQQGGGDTRIDYIEVPLTVGGVAPMANGDVRFRLYTGIIVGFKVGCGGDATFTNCDFANSPIWSWPLGFQIGRYSRSGVSFAADVRYSWALTDAFTNSATTTRTWVFRIILGKELRRR